MTQIDTKNLTVYYDGLCVLCAKEMDHYKNQKGSDSIHFVDIMNPQFDAAAEGLDPKLVHKIMHVKNKNGEVITGVDSFIEIWNHLPKYNWLASLAKNRLIKHALKLGYNGFIVIRPYLPRKKGCETSPYCETRSKND